MRIPLRSLPVAALLAACTTVRAVQPTELSAPHAPTHVTVTRAEHPPVVFDAAHLSGDSLVGLVNGARQAIPLSEVTVIRTRQASQVRTTALALGLTGVTVALAYEFLFKPSHQFACGEGGGCCEDCLPVTSLSE